MKTFRFLIVLLAIAVGFAGLNADAKVKKRKTTRRAAKAKVVETAPTNYDYVQGTYVEDQIFEMSKYPPEYPGGTEGLIKFLSDNINYPSSAEKKGVHSLRVSDVYNDECTSGPFRVLGISKQVFNNTLKALNSANNRVLIAELVMGLDSITLREDFNSISCLESLL